MSAPNEVMTLKYIEVYDIGVNQVHNCDTFDVNRPDGIDKWLLLIVKSCACFRINGKDVITEPNTAIFYPPRTPQIYHGVHGGEHYQEHWMEFDLDPTVMEEMGIPFCVPITDFDSEEIDSLFSLLMNEHYFGGDKKARYIELFMTAVLEKISEAVGKTANHQDAFHALRKEIINDPEKDWNHEAVAKSLNFSVSDFRNFYRNLFGVTFEDDVIHQRIHQACLLLTETDYPVSRIGDMCGYHSDNHFLRQFKQITGTTPSQYRNQGDGRIADYALTDIVPR